MLIKGLFAQSQHHGGGVSHVDAACNGIGLQAEIHPLSLLGTTGALAKDLTTAFKVGTQHLHGPAVCFVGGAWDVRQWAHHQRYLLTGASLLGDTLYKPPWAGLAAAWVGLVHLVLELSLRGVGQVHHQGVACLALRVAVNGVHAAKGADKLILLVTKPGVGPLAHTHPHGVHLLEELLSQLFVFGDGFAAFIPCALDGVLKVVLLKALAEAVQRRDAADGVAAAVNGGVVVALVALGGVQRFTLTHTQPVITAKRIETLVFAAGAILEHGGVASGKLHIVVNGTGTMEPVGYSPVRHVATLSTMALAITLINIAGLISYHKNH